MFKYFIIDKVIEEMHKKVHLSLDTFNFHLPEDLIAQKPLENKEEANLLWVENDQIIDYKVKNIVDLLEENDVLVINNTKVIPARLIGKKNAATITLTLHYQINNTVWLVFAKNSKRLKVEDVIVFANEFSCKVLEKLNDGEIKVEFQFDYIKYSIFEMLEKYGSLPLPPYIKRDATNSHNDKKDYQSIFAEKEGAVAAPTASLHFSESLIAKIKDKGVQIAYVTLHVGAGTFLPIKTENVYDHKMHKEYGEIDKAAVEKILTAKNNGGNVVAVGTTSLRVLEYVAEQYGNLKEFKGEIDLFILPNFKFKVVDKLITNFHLPRSTLFMLVSAFSGLETMKACYQHAIARRYRFFSYGDCCFLNKRSIKNR